MGWRDMRVPEANETANVMESDAIGNKTDTGVQAAGTTASILAYLKGLIDMMDGTTGITTFPTAAAAANNVSLAEVVRYIQESGTDAILAQLSGTAGIASFPAAAAAANSVSLAEVIRYIQENGTDLILAQLSGTTGIASFPASAAPANNISLAEVLRQVYDQTAVGSVFSITKTVSAAAVVAAGVDLTGVSSGGALLVEDVIVQTVTAVDSTGHGAVVNILNNNTNGNAAFMTMAQAKLPANGTCDGKNATTFAKSVLETGKKLTIAATTEDVTSSGNLTVTVVFRRLAATSTIAAAA